MAPQLLPPPDADSTQSIAVPSSFKPFSKSTSKKLRTAQREGITNSKTTESASSSQLPVHLVTNSLPPPNALHSRALRENISNFSLPVVPGLEEALETPHPQEHSRNQITVIGPHTEQVDATAFIKPSVKPPTSYPPPTSYRKRRANASHAEQIDRTAPIQPPAEHPIPSSPSFSDRIKMRSNEQARKDPLSASRRPLATPEHTPATRRTKPSRRRHKDRDPSAMTQRPPVPPKDIPISTTDLSSLQNREIPTATPDRPPARLLYTTATRELPSLPDLKDASVAPSRLPASFVDIGHPLAEGGNAQYTTGNPITQRQPTGRISDSKNRPSKLASSKDESYCSTGIKCPCCGIQCACCDISCVCCGAEHTWCCVIC